MNDLTKRALRQCKLEFIMATTCAIGGPALMYGPVKSFVNDNNNPLIVARWVIEQDSSMNAAQKKHLSDKVTATITPAEMKSRKYDIDHAPADLKNTYAAASKVIAKFDKGTEDRTHFWSGYAVISMLTLSAVTFAKKRYMLKNTESPKIS